MARNDVIARRYAKGLAEEANANGSMEAVRRDLRALAKITDPRAGSAYVPEFMRFLSSPVVPPPQKREFIDSVARQAGFGGEVTAFLKVLVEHGRIGVIPRIAPVFAEMAGPLTGVYTAVVHTARPLNDDQAARLRRVLATSLGAEVVLHQLVEPGLLAGAKVVVGDKTIDGTVLGKLERLRFRLATRGVLDFEDLQQETGEAAANDRKKG